MRKVSHKWSTNRLFFRLIKIRIASLNHLNVYFRNWLKNSAIPYYMERISKRSSRTRTAWDQTGWVYNGRIRLRDHHQPRRSFMVLHSNHQRHHRLTSQTHRRPIDRRQLWPGLDAPVPVQRWFQSRKRMDSLVDSSDRQVPAGYQWLKSK